MIRADRITIEEDEGRIMLVVEGDGAALPKLWIDIHDIAVEFHDDVRREIGPWAHEANSARRAVAAGVSKEDYLGSPQPVTVRPVSVEDAVEAGYALDDPKSPGYHDRMVD